MTKTIIHYLFINKCFFYISEVQSLSVLDSANVENEILKDWFTNNIAKKEWGTRFC